MISKLMLIEQKTLKQLIGNNTNVDVYIVKDILKLDPTLKSGIISNNTEIGIYGEWLLGKLYKNYNHLTDKDKNNIKEKLQFYDYLVRSKRIPQQYNNIYKIKSIEELIDIVNKIQGDTPVTQDPILVAIINHKFKTVSGNPLDLLKQQYYGEIKENGNTKWIVFNPKNKEQSIVAGYGSKWCTSEDNSNNRWNTYVYGNTTVWIFLLSSKYKINNPVEFDRLANKNLDKVCIIVERGECRDKIDNQFKLDSLPEIGKFIENKIDSWEIKLETHDILHAQYREGIKNILTGIKNPNNRLRLLLNEDKLAEIITTLPEKIQKFYLYHLPHLQIYFNTNITKKEQLQMIYKNPKSIKHLVKNNIEIDENMQLELLSKNNYLYNLLEAGVTLSEKVQLYQASKYVNQIKDMIHFGLIPSENVQLQQVEIDGEQIQYIIESGIIPTENVQLQQVENSPEELKTIINSGINPSENVQLQQVSQDGELIRILLYIEDINISDNVLIQQLTQDIYYYYVQDIIDKNIPLSHDVLLQMVENNGEQIEYILDNNLSPVTDDILIQQGVNDKTQIIYALDFGIKPSEEVQLQWVSEHGDILYYLIDSLIQVSDNVKLQQVSNAGEQISYIENPSKEMQLQQVKNNPNSIKFIKDPDEETQLQQVQNNPFLIYHILYPTENVQIQQISQDTRQFWDIRMPTPKQAQLYDYLTGVKESTHYISKLLDIN